MNQVPGAANDRPAARNEYSFFAIKLEMDNTTKQEENKLIVLKDNERLYLTTWNYNAAKILSHLAKIVTDNGGRVKPMKNAVISNRTRDAAMREYREKIERYTELEKANHNPARANAIREYSEKLQRLEMINNDPITVTHTSYIRFVLNDTMYYYQVNDNMFFDFYYSKIPIVNGEYNSMCYSDGDKKEWLYDCFFRADCSDADIIEAANMIFNMLMNAKFSTVCRRERPRMERVDF